MFLIFLTKHQNTLRISALCYRPYTYHEMCSIKKLKLTYGFKKSFLDRGIYPPKSYDAHLPDIRVPSPFPLPFLPQFLLVPLYPALLDRVPSHLRAGFTHVEPPGPMRWSRAHVAGTMQALNWWKPLGHGPSGSCLNPALSHPIPSKTRSSLISCPFNFGLSITRDNFWNSISSPNEF